MSMMDIPPLSLGRIRLHRWHSRDYFHDDPEDFFLNFLECEHTFLSRGRFAGSGLNSGFYFGSSLEVILSEKLFYEDRAISAESPEELLQYFLRRYTHLQVTAHIDRVLDLASAEDIKLALRKTNKIVGDLDSLRDLTFFEMILSSDMGGSDITDVIGYCAFDQNYSGVRFPSVRILTENVIGLGITPRSYGYSDLRGIPNGDMLGDAYLMQQQLAEDWNIVLFGGSEIIRVVEGYSFVDEKGRVRREKNPYFQKSAQAVREERCRRAVMRGLSLEEGIRVGLTDDLEIMAAYRPLRYPQFTLTVGSDKKA